MMMMRGVLVNYKAHFDYLELDYFMTKKTLFRSTVQKPQMLFLVPTVDPGS